MSKRFAEGDDEYGKVDMNPNVVDRGTVIAGIHAHPREALTAFSPKDYGWVQNYGLDLYSVIMNQDGLYYGDAYLLTTASADCSDSTPYEYERPMNGGSNLNLCRRACYVI